MDSLAQAQDPLSVSRLGSSHTTIFATNQPDRYIISVPDSSLLDQCNDNKQRQKKREQKNKQPEECYKKETVIVTLQLSSLKEAFKAPKTPRETVHHDWLVCSFPGSACAYTHLHGAETLIFSTDKVIFSSNPHQTDFSLTEGGIQQFHHHAILGRNFLRFHQSELGLEVKEQKTFTFFWRVNLRKQQIFVPTSNQIPPV